MDSTGNMSLAEQQAFNFEMALVNAGLRYDRDDIEASADDVRPHFQLVYGGGDFSFSRLAIHVVFDPDGSGAHFTTSPITRARDEKFFSLAQACNSANAMFRWAKFYIDSDGDIVCDADIPLREGSEGTECVEVVTRLADIVDEAYESIMKAAWSE